MRFIRLFFVIVFVSLGSMEAQASELSIKPLIDINYRPDASTDEGGLWYQVEKIEEQVKISPYRVNDPALNEYLNTLICKLTPDYCSSIRVYVIDNPHFNATIYPNGMMHIWTGLFLRVENEAQLAAVLGHEIGHYLQTHQVQQFRELKDAAATAMFLDIAIGGLTGVVGIGSLIGSSTLASFGRDQEREADIIGLELMGHAGYDTDEASQLWNTIIQERDADKSKEERSIFWATHPASEERFDNLSKRSILFKDKWHKPFVKKEARYREHLSRIYLDAMSGHVSLQEFEQTAQILQRHEKLDYDKSLINYFYGELYRMRGHEGDSELSMVAYKESLHSVSCPSNAYKQLGYLYLKQKNNSQAKKYFQGYLERSPEAEDKAMINYYMELLK